MEVSVHTYFAYNFDTLFRANLSKMAFQGITQPFLSFQCHSFHLLFHSFFFLLNMHFLELTDIFP